MRQLDKLYALDNHAKNILAIVWDTGAIFLGLIVAYWIRVGFSDWHFDRTEWIILCLNTILTLAILTITGYYRQVVRFISIRAFYNLVISASLSVLFLFLMYRFAGLSIPKSVPFIYWTLCIVFMGLPRFIIKASAQSQTYKMREKCIIFGAAQAGRMLAHSLKMGGDLHPVAFIDDKQKYQGKVILGLNVGCREDIPKFVEQYGVTKMLLAVHNTSKNRRKELIEELEPYAIELLSIPDVHEIVSGRHKINELREIQIEELLGRDPVKPIQSLLEINIQDKVVMVTGAGGSIGSELCRQIIKSKPSKLILFELSEFNLYQIERELINVTSDILVIPMLASVQDLDTLTNIIREHKVQTIYHAAAYKHVPMVESNPLAGIRNNIFGTANVAKAARACQVEKFVLISTDKAVRPTNVMGATKRLAELYIQGIAEQAENTDYVIVRFGNVLGSSGSVVPLFSKQIHGGGPVTVTHPDIIRYFMTIPEAAQLVIQAGAMGHKGQVFVLDMGEPVKIVDLAHKMAHLLGHKLRTENEPDGTMDLLFTGLRPGEKLYEELLIDDADTKTQHPLIMGADEMKIPFDEVNKLMVVLNDEIMTNDHQGVRDVLQAAPLGYTPSAH